jgi:hypothetical protein
MGDIDRIGQSDINWSFAEKLAWKRSGYKSRESLEQAVRDLPLEQKVEMLIELNMREIADMLFEEKQDFLLSLGKKTWVDAEESYEYAKKAYKGKEYRIDERDFQPVYIVNGSRLNQANSIVMEKFKEKRKIK